MENILPQTGKHGVICVSYFKTVCEDRQANASWGFKRILNCLDFKESSVSKIAKKCSVDR